MEETLGKRIVSHRKRLGLTQDGLAERLGVTAQAISKWENNQSCPDIAMIPTLADLFGITTDELLGREVPKTVYQGEVITHADDEEDNSKGHWEIKWDSGRKGASVGAWTILLTGVMLLAGKFLHWDLSFWDVLWRMGLIVFGLGGIFPNFSFFHVGCLIFGVASLLNELQLLPYLDDGMIWPVILILLGLSLLADAMKRPKKPRFHVIKNGKDISKKIKKDFHTDEESFQCSLSFGEDTRQISLPRLSGGSASCNFGELTLDLTTCGLIAPDAELELNCSFGEIDLHVPRQYRVESRSSTAFASVEFIGQPDPAPLGTIYLDANVNFGCIEVHYI